MEIALLCIIAVLLVMIMLLLAAIQQDIKATRQHVYEVLLFTQEVGPNYFQNSRP